MCMYMFYIALKIFSKHKLVNRPTSMSQYQNNQRLHIGNDVTVIYMYKESTIIYNSDKRMSECMMMMTQRD